MLTFFNRSELSGRSLYGAGATSRSLLCIEGEKIVHEKKHHRINKNAYNNNNNNNIDDDDNNNSNNDMSQLQVMQPKYRDILGTL